MQAAKCRADELAVSRILVVQIIYLGLLTGHDPLSDGVATERLAEYGDNRCRYCADSAHYGQIKRAITFEVRFDSDGYHFPCNNTFPSCGEPASLRLFVDKRLLDFLSMYSYSDQRFRPIMPLGFASEYDPVSRILTWQTGRREGHVAFSRHFYSEVPARNRNDDRYAKRGIEPLMLRDEVDR